MADQSINIPSDSGSSISVSKTQIAALIAAGGIIPGEYYTITDPILGGSIVLQAVSPTKLSFDGTWLRPTNLPGFGWIRLVTGAAGSVDTLTVNGVDQMTASVPFLTSLNVTATNVAANINANINATYTALAILDTIVVYQKVASSLANTHVVAATTTTITTGFVQNIVNGYDPVIKPLIITYDINVDQIRSCIDPVHNNKMHYSENSRNNLLALAPPVEPFNSFRWCDPCFQGNTMDQGIIKDVFCAGTGLGTAGLILDNYVTGQAGITNCCVTSSSLIFYNFIEFVSGATNGINNNLMIGINTFISRSRICFARMQNNILSGSGSFITGIEMLFSTSQTGGVFGNTLSGASSQISTIVLGGQVASIANNILSGASSNIFDCKLFARNAAISSNTLSSANASIRSCHLIGEGSTINSNTISSTASNPTIRHCVLSGFNATINSNIIANTLIATAGITGCVLQGNASGINSMNFAVAANIQNLVLEAVSAIFTGYTFDATFNNLINIHWRADNTLRYNMVKTGLTNTANNGATGSDIRIGLLPVAKIYPSSAMIEGNGLVGVGASVNVGIETDDTDNIIPTTAIVALPDGTIVQSVVALTKSAAANRRVVMQVTGASLTAGAVQITAEFKISNF